MKTFTILLLAFFFATSFTIAQNTYTIGQTEYYYNQTYSTTGKPMVKRSEANKKVFLQSRGYDKTPAGYEVDHIIPLSQGGSDSPYNMQLLTVQQHKAKTARERANTSRTTLPRFNSPNSTYTLPGRSYKSTTTKLPTFSSPASTNRVIQTGPRGGRYYINKNGNKTYVKN